MVMQMKPGEREEPSVYLKLEALRGAWMVMEAVLVSLSVLELDRANIAPPLDDAAREECLSTIQQYAHAVLSDRIAEAKRNGS